MLSVYQFKPKFQRLLMPLLNQLHQNHITANCITVFAIAFSGLMGVLLFFAPKYPGLLVLFAVGLVMRMALNALDGMMAKTYHQQSKKGEVLNEAGDVVSDVFMFCGLLGFEFCNPVILLVFVTSAVINEFSGVLAKVVSGTRRYDGPMGKSDRALVIGLWCLAFFFFPVVANSLNAVLLVAVVLMVLSSYKRLSYSLNNR